MIIIISLPFAAGPVKIFNVESPSMEPTINKGSYVFVMKQPSYSLGDIITFKSSQSTLIVTHRIVKIEKIFNTIFITTKGDSNEYPDSNLVSLNEILGKVVFSIPYLGTCVSFIFSYRIISLTFYAPLGFIAGKLLKDLYFLSN